MNKPWIQKTAVSSILFLVYAMLRLFLTISSIHILGLVDWHMSFYSKASSVGQLTLCSLATYVTRVHWGQPESKQDLGKSSPCQDIRVHSIIHAVEINRVGFFDYTKFSLNIRLWTFKYTIFKIAKREFHNWATRTTCVIFSCYCSARLTWVRCQWAAGVFYINDLPGTTKGSSEEEPKC